MPENASGVGAPMQTKPFGDIADEAGWDDATRLAVLLDFISEYGYHEQVASHAQMKADDGPVTFDASAQGV